MRRTSPWAALLMLGPIGCGAAGTPGPAPSAAAGPTHEGSSPMVRRIDGTTISAAEIDATVTRLMAAAHVPGLALAILNDGRVVHLRGYGVRNADTGAPMTVDSVMVGASFTKAVFAVAVMQLVAEGVLDLDVPIARYLAFTELPAYRELAGDPRAARITARMLLGHTSGLPNWRRFNDDGRLDLAGEPGARFSYSGEGIVLLQRVVEHLTGRSAAEVVRARVLAPLGMGHTSLVWQPALADEAAVGHDGDGRVIGHDRRDRPDAAGSMDTTIRDWAAFLAALQRHQLLAPASRAEMLRPQIRIQSAREFPPRAPETTAENDGIALSYGLGWGLFATPRGHAFFKEGHDDGWQHHTVVFDEAGVAIAIMTDSDRGDRTFRALLGALIGDTYTPWRWEGYAAEP